MDLQERAVIAAVQLKTATYTKDRQAALKEALDIVNEDSLIGGTEFIDPLISLLICNTEAYPPEVQSIFKILIKIFTEQNGREFSNIFLSKVRIEFILRLITGSISEEVEDIRNTVFILIKYNKPAITKGIIELNQIGQLIEKSLMGNEIVLNVLVEIGKDSITFRKLLIFNGFIDGLMKFGCGKNRTLARCGIKSLAELMNRDVSIVNYFFEMRWKEWMEFTMKTHPEHALKILYAFSSYPKYTKYLSEFSEIIFSGRDMAALYLLSFTEGSAEKWSFFSEVDYNKNSNARFCPCRLNFILGIHSNLSQKIPKNIAAVRIGTPEYFGIISNYSIVIDDEAVNELLNVLPHLPTISLTDSLLVIKTAICIGLRSGSQKLFSPDVLLTLREHLQNDLLIEDIRILIGFWLFLAYTKIRNTPSVIHSIFNDIEESVLPLAKKLLTSLTQPLYNKYCEEKECNRCYLLQMNVPNVIPHSLSLLAQLVWLPNTMHSLVLFTFAEFLDQPILPPVLAEPVHVDTETIEAPIPQDNLREIPKSEDTDKFTNNNSDDGIYDL
ncbi:hypothetical protein NEPAR06_1107 [Nematocida parisii]|nr:hypothetical protein NEPAR07_1082 [Nematocida parisii]KAI5154422.1 hypothetical protein NEPAR06_1107 [Nematocida parisii]KAI5157095.1 hypothetical protein NEPAR05_1022 [Nematocida parisii]